jgi:hypothetical protein
MSHRATFLCLHGMRTPIFCSLLLLAGCWADFPASRMQSDSGVDDQLRDRSRDLPPKTDSTTDAARDGRADSFDVGLNDLRVDQRVDRSGDSRSDAVVDQQPPDQQLPDQQLPDQQPPDQQPPDQQPPDQQPPDTFSCRPLSFIRCDGPQTLRRCHSSGLIEETVGCAPHACNASAGRCNQCDPAMTPVCQNGDVLACSTDGLEQRTVCPFGCNAGRCCVDGDSDTQTDCQGDCDDNDTDVYVGQLSFFPTQRKSGGYDYDCDKAETFQYPDLVNCRLSDKKCIGDGWQTSVPACGQSGVFVVCRRQGNRCKEDTQQDIQACH